MEALKLPLKQTVIQYIDKNVREIRDADLNTVLQFPFDFPKEKAAFVVKACNYHQDLYDACQNLLNGAVDRNSVHDLLCEIRDGKG